MKTDTEIRIDGLKALTQTLGAAGAERFISLIMLEPFDYTKLQRNLFVGKTIDEISKSAMELRKEMKRE